MNMYRVNLNMLHQMGDNLSPDHKTPMKRILWQQMEISARHSLAMKQRLMIKT